MSKVDGINRKKRFEIFDFLVKLHNLSKVLLIILIISKVANSQMNCCINTSSNPQDNLSYYIVMQLARHK